MYGSRIHPIVSCKAFHPPSINIAAIKAEIEIAREIYKTASEHHHSLYQGQQYIIGVISNLERKLEQALKRDRALNQARGKRQRRTSHKRGKHTRKRRQ